MTDGVDEDPALDALVDGYLARLRAGEVVDPEDAARAHPAHAARLRRLLPILALVEGAKAPPPPPARPAAAGPAPVPVPATVGPWRVVRELGRGGMGRVFEAVDASGRRAAVKVPHAHLLELPGVLERFRQEAEVGRRVDHPSVVRTLDAGRATLDGRETPWIALELVEGQTLRQILRDAGTLSERWVRTLGHALAEALAAVHATGLVHRDVKPENVVITPREEVRLMDLGFALVRDATVRLSGTGSFVGTLLYAAPEQLTGEPVGPAADLYALGLLLGELVSGRHPAAARGASGPPTEPGTLPADATGGASPFFAAVVAALLAPAPADRLADAALVATILREGEASAWWRARAVPRRPWRAVPEAAELPLLGRDTELARLDDAYAAARAGSGRVVLVEGEAGLGKTRLVQAWAERLEGPGGAGARVAWATHVAADVATVVPPVSAALRDLVAPERELHARLAVLLDEGARLVEPFADHLRGRLDPAAAPLPEPSLWTAHRLLLRGLAREGVVVVVAEDLDEASEASQRLFLALARAAEHERVVLVATGAPSWPPAFGDAIRALPHAEVVTLEPLGRDASHDLFLAALGGAPTTAPWHDAVRGAAGNPLCLLEWARAARTGAPVAVDRAVPRVLSQLVEARLAALDPAGARLLAVAACVGERFDPVVVVDAAGEGRLAGLRRLHRLDRDERLLVAEAATYRFRHAYVRDVLYADLPASLRAELHGAVAAALEATPPGDAPDARAFAIADHHLRSAVPRRALPFAGPALRHASAASRPRESAALASALLRVPGGLEPRLEAQAEVQLGTSRIPFATSDEVIPPLERGVALARAQGDDALTSFAALELSAALRHAGRPEEALALADEAAAAAARTGSAARLANAAIGRSAALFDLGRLDASAAAAAEVARFAEASGDAWARCNAAYHLGIVRLEQGDAGAARAALDAAARDARTLDDFSLETSVVTALSKADFLDGRLADAAEHIERLVALARDHGHLRAELIARSNLGWVELALARLDAARRVFAAAVETARRIGFPDVVAHAGAGLGAVETLRGEGAVAAAAFEDATRAAAGLSSPVIAARIAARRLLLLAGAGRFEEARALYDAHAAPTRAAGAHRERLLLEEGRAELLDAAGDPRGAADVYEAMVAEAAPRGLRQEGARWAAALGVLRLRLGDAAAARRRLSEAQATADRMGLRDVAAAARIHAATLPGAERVPGRVALTEHGEVMGVRARLVATAALADATGDPVLWRRALADLDHLVARAPEAWRGSVRDGVARHREIRAAAERAGAPDA